MSEYVFDIETFRNFWCSTFLNVEDSQDIRTYKIAWDMHIDDRDEMKEFLSTKVSRLIGYNNLFYDTPILSYICEYNGKDLNQDVYEMSTRIISSDRGENFSNKRVSPWPQLDLMKMMAFDKLGVGLKQCAINLKWNKIQDLPLPYDKKITREDIELIVKYNVNDVLISFELFKALQPQIQLRKQLGEIYGVDISSASDSKIANVLLEKFYTDQTGTDIKEIRNLRTKREFLWLKDCICPGIKFKTKKLRNLKFETANTLVVAENNFAYKKKLEFANCKYELGVGGLHSDDGPAKFVADEKYIICDADVASYYPNIIINNKIKPDHLNEDFVEILKKITKERIEAKKSGDKVKADGLKITINSIFGKLGSETFWLEDAKAMLTVTVSGQLFLMMLIESLTLAGITVISANTDGIVCKIPRELEKEFHVVCGQWQQDTGFELEFTHYNMYVRSDVNNYIVKKDTGETKEKGRYLKEVDLKKGYHYPIVARCLYEYYVNGKSLFDTVHDAEDILDFCISQKSGRDFNIEYRTEDETESLQKTNRFYISNSGGSMMKINKTNGKEIGIYVGETAKILNDHDKNLPIDSYDIDYNFYMEEAMKYIEEIDCSEFPETLKQEELSTDLEDGIELEIDNLDTSKITIKPPKFRHSKSSYYFDKENNIIYRGIGSLKYVTSSVAEELEKLAENDYSTFVDLLVDIEEKCSINTRQMNTLIKLSFFEEFGKNKKLTDIYEEFNDGKNRYNKKLKESTKESRRFALIEFEKSVPDKSIPVTQQIYFELELLNYVQTTFPLDRKYVFVKKLDTKYSPRLDVMCLANGKDATLKIQRKIYDNNIILGGDIVYCKRFNQKTAVSYVDGNFVPDESKDKVWWLEEWHVLTQEEIDKLLD